MGRRINGYWLRRGPSFFSWDVDSNKVSLFDVKTDPKGTRELSGAYPLVIEDFKARIERWREDFERDSSP
jgi:hypothetical protein